VHTEDEPTLDTGEISVLVESVATPADLESGLETVSLNPDSVVMVPPQLEDEAAAEQLVPLPSEASDKPRRSWWARSSRKEREDRERSERFTQFLGRTRFVPVLSRKGGVGATTVTTLLGMALAVSREEMIIALDASPDRGNLHARVGAVNSSGIAELAEAAPSIREASELGRYLVRDKLTGLQVLAARADPLSPDPLLEGDYHLVSDLLARHAGIILTDGGVGFAHPTIRAALLRADTVVIVSGGGVDEARFASESLDWLETFFAHLLSGAVVAINTATMGTDLERLEEITAHFVSRVSSVIHLPYDPSLAGNAAIHWDNLEQLTRDSALDAAALLVGGLAGSVLNGSA